MSGQPDQLDSQTRALAARLLGMKPSEIRAVEETADGTVVTTHDGVRTQVTIRDDARHDVAGQRALGSADVTLTVVAAPTPVPRNPATGETTPPTGTAQPLVPQPDGTTTPRAAAPIPEDELCPTCDGSGRVTPEERAALVVTLPPPPVTAPDPDAADGAGPVLPEEVRTGTAAVVEKWVGDDPDRARVALDAEAQRDRPRAGLTDELEKRLAKAERTG